MTGRTEPAERLVSLPAIAEIEFLPNADGRLLDFIRHEPPNTSFCCKMGDLVEV